MKAQTTTRMTSRKVRVLIAVKVECLEHASLQLVEFSEIDTVYINHMIWGSWKCFSSRIGCLWLRLETPHTSESSEIVNCIHLLKILKYHEKLDFEL